MEKKEKQLIVKIDEVLARDIKAKAAQEGTSLKKIIESLLREYLKKRG